MDASSGPGALSWQHRPPQIALANEAVAAMKNRLSEDRAMVGMRQGELS
jgi:hypothetical protein